MKSIINKIKKTIKNTKFENKTFICGGFVRDIFLNKSSKDIDIVVNLEKGGLELAKLLYNLKIGSGLVVFERFGTAQLIIDGEQIEFVETRKEFYNEDNRNPEITFGSIEDDINRRDFTINSLLLDISNNEVIDLKNGRNDIQNKIIRTTSDSDLIFSEDPLRMLRAIRFVSQLDFNIEQKTLDSITTNSSRLKIISKERIRDEFSKILLGINVNKAIRLLITTGLIKFILPELAMLDKLEQPKKYHSNDALSHTIDVVNSSKNTIEHKLAGLLHDIGKPFTKSLKQGEIIFYNHQFESEKIAKRFLKEFKFTNKQIDLIALAVKHHMSWCNDISNKSLKKFINKHGVENTIFCLELGLADVNFRNEKRKNKLSQFISLVNEISEELDSTGNFSFPFNGNDIMNTFNVKGKEVGKLLELAKEMFLEDNSLTKEEVLLKLSNLVNASCTN